MELIYKNFDGLEISFQGAVAGDVLSVLRKAKGQAMEERKSAPARIGESEHTVMVAETGMRGGYTFVFDTGIDRETWFVADTNKRDRWNIRVSIKSLNFALGDYFEVKTRILDFLLNTLGAKGQFNGINDIPLERISRLDYCLDFQTPFFEPDPKLITAHTRSNRTFHLSKEGFDYSAKGKLIESVRIGKMPNRQLAVYNKKNEIIAKKKKYWWDVWGINSKDFKEQIWRFEVRAGKNELNKWNLRRFEDFETKAGDVVLSIFKAIRFVSPNQNDSNQWRWKNQEFWNLILEEAKGDLFEYVSNAERKEILEGQRIELIEMFNKQLSGGLTSLAALEGYDLSQMTQLLEQFGERVMDDLKFNEKKKQKKFDQAKEKYSLLK